jgi:hypothetical protein
MALEMDDRFHEIVSIVRQRVDADPQRIRDMIDVRDRYNGDWIVPIPDVEGQEALPAPVPYLMAEAVDQTAMRAASVMPYIEVPAVVRATGLNGGDLRAYAAIRRRAHYARWDYSALDLLLARGFRHVVGYGTMALMVMPDFNDSRARIVLRDPLTAYPEHRDPEDVRPPLNAAFVYSRSRDWIVKNYPEARGHLGAHSKGRGSHDDVWDVFEWQDAEETIIGLLGPRYPGGANIGLAARDALPHLPLRRWPNRAGMCTAYVPQRVTLSKIMSQVAKMVPLSDLWAKMMALDVVAAEKAIFTDKYALGAENRTPAIVSGGGTWQDGRTGEINILENVSAIGALNDGPGAAAQPVIDRLERAIRINTGALPQFGGENPSSMRTGRALDSMQAMAIDPRIQELHTTARYALKAVNEQAMAVEEGYWPNRTFVVFSGWSADPGMTEYQPAKHFQSDAGGRAQSVTYPISGADLSQTNVALGQMIGAGLMSKKNGRRVHPLIPDSENEETTIDYERMKDAVVLGFNQQVAAGGVSLENAARIAQDLADGDSVLEAIVKENQRAREEAEAAAREAAEQQGAGGPEGAMPPTAMQPGIQPGADAASAAASPALTQQLAQIPPPTTSQERFRQLNNALRARA